MLTVFRIPGSLKEHQIRKDKPVILLWHGLLDSSDLFILNKHRKAHAFLLSDMGYDVWLANSRGNKYSKKHLKYEPTDAEFWDYTFQEIGEYDVPAVFNFIEKVTNHRKIAYMGHSQACPQMFYALAENPEFYKDRISLLIAMAPTVFIGGG